MDEPSCRTNVYLAQWHELGFIVKFTTNRMMTHHFWVEGIGCDLTWRGMGPAKSACLKHATHELIPLWFSQVDRIGQVLS